MCALRIALSPELRHLGVRSQSCFVSPSCARSLEQARVFLRPAKGLGSLGRGCKWYHYSFRIQYRSASNYSHFKITGFEIRGSSQASSGESFDELLDPTLASGEGADFVGSVELRRKQDLARLSADLPLRAEGHISDEESDLEEDEQEGNGSFAEENTGNSLMFKEAAVAERLGSAKAVGIDERQAGKNKAEVKVEDSGDSKSAVGEGVLKLAWDKVKDNPLFQFLNIWPAWQQKKRLERILAQADANPKDTAKQAALLAELYKQGPQVVIERFERREHATDSQAVVEYLRALVATNAITEYLPDHSTGRTSGLPELLQDLKQMASGNQEEPFSPPGMTEQQPLHVVMFEAMFIVRAKRCSSFERQAATNASHLSEQLERLGRREAFATLSLLCSVQIMTTQMPGKLLAEEAKKEGANDDQSVIGGLLSLFDPNETTKQGKKLPKAYLKSAREVVESLRASFSEDSKDDAKFRRNADSAKGAIRDYISNWRGAKLVDAEESYQALERALRVLSEFYSKKGPRAALPEDVRGHILEDLQKADDAL